MSIKKLFGKKSNKITQEITQESTSKEIESFEFANAISQEKERVIPDVNFLEPESFARYGLAKKYYQDAITSVIKTYPYDGSKKEKIEWHNQSYDVTNYIYENKYPKTTGFITLGKEYGNTTSTIKDYDVTDRKEYIYFYGTLNTDNNATTLKKKFELSNKYDLAKGRFYNLSLNGQDGATVEFYLHKDNNLGSSKQVIFDLWNSSSYGTSEYGRFKIETNANNEFIVEVSSGSSGTNPVTIGTNLNFVGEWHHYAIAFINQEQQLKLQLFQDGDIIEEKIVGTKIDQVYGPMVGQIGALITEGPSSEGVPHGAGKLSGSLDELRFWKRKRTDKEVYLNYFTSVGGGANTDDANTDLGLYYKFNEGIHPQDSVNSTVLDYSGRISNGKWVGFSSQSRSTASGLELSNNTTKEQKDPIMYATHPDVTELHLELEKIADLHDKENNYSIYSSLPSWITDEDLENGGQIKQLTQIMSSFLDDLHLKIQFLPTIKHNEYSDSKPLPFTSRMLEGLGFDLTEIFSDLTVLENFSNRNETQEFEEKIYNVKNFIYKNIYNNLLYIYKSKGTEKSFRNLMRCFGIDDELLKLNLYADGVDFTFQDRFNYTTEKKKYVDFNNIDRLDSTVFQAEEPSNVNSVGFITSSLELKNLGTTMEAEVIFPSKFSKGEPFYFRSDFVSSSLFGMHESENGTWKNPDRASIQVFALKEEEESNNVKFVMSSSYFGINEHSKIFKQVYDEQKWNFALRLRHEKYPQVGIFSNSQNGNYVAELYGVSSIQDIKQESFLLTASVDSSLAQGFYEANKMIYVGAHRNNFSGSVVVGSLENGEQFSDTKITSVRFWHSYLDNDIIDLHSKDVFNYGPNSPLSNLVPFTNLNKVSQIDSLALHWDFNSVSSSDNGTGISTLSDGEFIVEDVSSGSLELLDDSDICKYTKYQMTGKGAKFPRNSTDVVQNEFVYSAKRRLPEVLNNNDLIEVLERDDEFFTRESRPVNHYFAIEKSMYQIISEDILNMFGTVKDFNNLIGRPQSRYESSYKNLEKLRQLYFKNVQNNPDFEKFIEFYRWIDESISRIIEQLIPASMNYTPGISNVIESHILERNKYAHKLPTIEFKGEPPLGPAKTINELLYRWKTGHAPLSGLQSDNCQWWFLRSERKEQDRIGIYNARTSALNRNFSTVYNFQTDLSPIVSDKKRETEIIRNEIGFDINGLNYYEITDLLPIKKVCND